MYILPVKKVYFDSALHFYDPLELVWWYWLEIWECALPRGLRFDSLRCQFKWANLVCSKNKKKIVHYIFYLSWISRPKLHMLKEIRCCFSLVCKWCLVNMFNERIIIRRVLLSCALRAQVKKSKIRIFFYRK